MATVCQRRIWRGISLGFRIVIVTRDSAPWIGIIAYAYRRLGLRPLYLVHDKTRDATQSILSDLGEDVQPVTMAHDRVESALSLLPGLVSEEWVLRMDDDEFPSRRMIAFTKAEVGRVKEQSITFARREALPHVSPLSYATAEVLYGAPLAPFHLEPQIRAFQATQVEYHDEIHTPGFTVASTHIAPPSAYMVHFNSTLRSLESRLAKLARYEKQAAGAGMLEAARFFLPELVPLEELRARPFETREFDALANLLHQVRLESKLEAVDPEWKARILAHLREARPTSPEELKLAQIRGRLDTIPAAIRAFFKLS